MTLLPFFLLTHNKTVSVWLPLFGEWEGQKYVGNFVSNVTYLMNRKNVWIQTQEQQE